MAHGVRKQLKVDVAVSVTGIAGPSGGTPDKPVGTVCFAVAGPGLAEDSIRKHFSGSRNEVQEASVRFAIEFLVSKLKI
jgi:PncC family amidohydrolase